MCVHQLTQQLRQRVARPRTSGGEGSGVALRRRQQQVQVVEDDERGCGGGGGVEAPQEGFLRVGQPRGGQLAAAQQQRPHLRVIRG